MTRRAFYVVLVTTVAFLMPTVAAAEDLCSVDDVVILATNSVKIERDSSVSGDVVANNASAGPVLDEGAEFALDRGAAVDGSVSGDSVDLDRSSSVIGNVSYNQLSKHATANIGGTQITPLSLPVFADLPEFETAVPSSFDLSVGAGATVVIGSVGGGGPLARRDFGDITIGTGGSLVLSGGGDFDARSVTGNSGASIEFDAASDLRVAGKFDSGSESFVGPAVGSGISAADIVIYVGGINGAGGGLFESPAAVEVGKNSIIQANIYAPEGRVELGQGTTAEGSIIGRDVQIMKNSVVTLDSAFGNEPPIAFAQEQLTEGASSLVITLEGLDPEGGALDFSIVVPADGSLGAITPIIPAPLDLCSDSGVACSVNSDCPGFAEGETCETVQPPVTQATVTYTPVAANCVTEPESGEVTCAGDFFTFGVTDECGALGTAIVSVNGGTDEGPGDPGSGVDSVEANDREIDTVVNQVRVITLSAAAPATIASLTFRVETLPNGALQDSNGAAVVAGADLPSPALTYQAPPTAGTDSFTFSARDSSTSSPPCGWPACDTGTVNIAVGNLPELAPDQSASTNLNTPVEITLIANAGGTGDGGGGGGGTFTAFTSPITEVTYGDNGPPPGRETLSRLAARTDAGRGFLSSQFPLTALGVDQGWQQFSWCDEASAGTSSVCSINGGACQEDTDCPDFSQGETCDEVSNCFSGALVDLINETPVIEGPFDFTLSEPSCLRVTDTLAKGDHWRVENVVGGSLDWTDRTSEVAQSTVGTTSDPDVAFGDLSYSHGAFDLGGDCTDVSGQQIACDHSISLITIPPDSFAWGTAGYLRVDTGPCIDLIWTVTSLPANGTLTNLDGTAVQIGGTYLSTPTVVYTPLYNVSGPDAFGYSVTQGATLGQVVVVDSAIVDLLISSTDPCIINGRTPGCAPGGGGGGTLLPPEGSSSSPSEDSIQGPELTIVVDGPGDVSSSRRWAGNESKGILVCGTNGSCSATFESGSAVMLYARPVGSESEFVGWGGACSGADLAAVVTVNAATTCTATFRERQR